MLNICTLRWILMWPLSPRSCISLRLNIEKCCRLHLFLYFASNRQFCHWWYGVHVERQSFTNPWKKQTFFLFFINLLYYRPSSQHSVRKNLDLSHLKIHEVQISMLRFFDYMIFPLRAQFVITTCHEWIEYHRIFWHLAHEASIKIV